MSWVLLALSGWALATGFVLALLYVAGSEDRAARDEQEAIAIRLRR
jgi:hypothetical protein